MTHVADSLVAVLSVSWGGGGLVVLIAVACDSQQSLGPTTQVTPAPVVGTLIAAPGHDLARAVAKTLADDGIRGALFQSMKASRVPEKKIHFAKYVASARGDRLRASAETVLHGRQMLDVLSDLPEFEFYMPVRAHRRAWKGGRDLVVAVQIEEDGPIIAFDLTGAPVEVSLDAPPETPTLVLTPLETVALHGPGPEGIAAESETTRVDVSLDSSEDCEPQFDGQDCCDGALDCHPGPGGGGPPSGGGPPFTIPAGLDTGFYFGQMRIWDKHEPWTRGDPELEVHITGYQVGAWVGSSIPGGSVGPFFGDIFFAPSISKSDIWSACSGRKAGPTIREFDFNEEGGATYQQFVLLSEASDFLQEEKIRVPDGPEVLARRFHVQPPYDIRIIERDDARECPKEPRKLDASFGVEVTLTPFSWVPTSGGGSPWELLLTIFGGNNDDVAWWRFGDFSVFEDDNVTYLDRTQAVVGDGADLWVFSKGLRWTQVPAEANFIF